MIGGTCSPKRIHGLSRLVTPAAVSASAVSGGHGCASDGPRLAELALNGIYGEPKALESGGAEQMPITRFRNHNSDNGLAAVRAVTML